MANAQNPTPQELQKNTNELMQAAAEAIIKDEKIFKNFLENKLKEEERASLDAFLAQKKRVLEQDHSSVELIKENEEESPVSPLEELKKELEDIAEDVLKKTEKKIQEVDKNFFNDVKNYLKNVFYQTDAQAEVDEKYIQSVHEKTNGANPADTISQAFAIKKRLKDDQDALFGELINLGKTPLDQDRINDILKEYKDPNFANGMVLAQLGQRLKTAAALRNEPYFTTSNDPESEKQIKDGHKWGLQFENGAANIRYSDGGEENIPVVGPVLPHQQSQQAVVRNVANENSNNDTAIQANLATNPEFAEAVENGVNAVNNTAGSSQAKRENVKKNHENFAEAVTIPALETNALETSKKIGQEAVSEVQNRSKSAGFTNNMTEEHAESLLAAQSNTPASKPEPAPAQKKEEKNQPREASEAEQQQQQQQQQETAAKERERTEKHAESLPAAQSNTPASQPAPAQTQKKEEKSQPPEASEAEKKQQQDAAKEQAKQEKERKQQEEAAEKERKRLEKERKQQEEAAAKEREKERKQQEELRKQQEEAEKKQKETNAQAQSSATSDGSITNTASANGEAEPGFFAKTIDTVKGVFSDLADRFRTPPPPGAPPAP